MSPLAVSPDLLRANAPASPALSENQKAMRRTAEAFEASFLSQIGRAHV